MTLTPRATLPDSHLPYPPHFRSSRRRCLRRETLRAALVDGVELAHQHQRHLRVPGAEFACDRKQRVRGDPGGKRAQVRLLNRGAVRHRIGKGHAKLDDVRAARDQRIQHFAGARGRGIAAGDEGDERGPALIAAFLETGGKAVAHSFTPSASATVKMSLSPRPDRLMTTIWSLSIFGTIFSAAAIAWLDSSAGMIPSSAHSFWKAASDSSSVTGTYSTRPISCSQLCSGPMPG